MRSSSYSKAALKNISKSSKGWSVLPILEVKFMTFMEGEVEGRRPFVTDEQETEHFTPPPRLLVDFENSK